MWGSTRRHPRRYPICSASEIKKLDKLPVIECHRSDVWAFLGFKHINGPQAWDSYPKAHYIAWFTTRLASARRDCEADR